MRWGTKENSFSHHNSSIYLQFLTYLFHIETDGRQSSQGRPQIRGFNTISSSQVKWMQHEVLRRVQSTSPFYRKTKFVPGSFLCIQLIHELIHNPVEISHEPIIGTRNETHLSCWTRRLKRNTMNEWMKNLFLVTFGISTIEWHKVSGQGRQLMKVLILQEMMMVKT
jgi:hypothetical protein